MTLEVVPFAIVCHTWYWQKIFKIPKHCSSTRALPVNSDKLPITIPLCTQIVLFWFYYFKSSSICNNLLYLILTKDVQTPKTSLIHPCIARKFRQIANCHPPLYANCPLLVAGRSANHWQQINLLQYLLFWILLQKSSAIQISPSWPPFNNFKSRFVMVCQTWQKIFKIPQPRKKWGYILSNILIVFQIRVIDLVWYLRSG